MLNCNENLLGPGGAGGQRGSKDPPDSERAVITATNGFKARALDGRLGDGGSGAEGGRVIRGGSMEG